jgi:photosystem I P700 chlorophyll a apoprotein A1
LAGLLGLGSLAWVGHQIHIAIPVNTLLDAGVDPEEIPLPHEWLLNSRLISQLYPSFAAGLSPFFAIKWWVYGDFACFCVIILFGSYIYSFTKKYYEIHLQSFLYND